MYNKLFAKIVRSSIWLEPTPTRLVWMMFIALMDEDGFIQMASIDNVAHTARIKQNEAKEAIKILESPDANSANQEHEGRRIERAPGGWIVINAKEYRDLVTRDMIRQQTAARVAKHRAKIKAECNAHVTHSNESETQSVSVSVSKKKEGANGSRPPSVEDWLKELEADKTYAGIDVRREYGKMLNWCKIRKKKPTQRRFVNWLNNADRPMTLNTPTAANVYGKNRLPPQNNISEEELAEKRKQVAALSAKLRDELKK